MADPGSRCYGVKPGSTNEVSLHLARLDNRTELTLPNFSKFCRSRGALPDSNLMARRICTIRATTWKFQVNFYLRLRASSE
jgi:hypothetical protein